MHPRLSVPVLAGLAVLAALPAAAQQPSDSVNSLAKGKYALSFSLPESGATDVTLWKALSRRSQVGVSLGVSATQSSGDGGGPLAAGLRLADAQVELRHFVRTSQPVAPFLGAAVFGDFNRQRSSTANPTASYVDRTWVAGVAGTAGVEWFPVRWVSVDGTVALALRYANDRHDQTYGGITTTSTSHGVSVGTGTSRLALKIYF